MNAVAKRYIMQRTCGACAADAGCEAGPVKLHIPGETGHLFRLKSATHSGGNRPPIPTGNRPLLAVFPEQVAGLLPE